MTNIRGMPHICPEASVSTIISVLADTDTDPSVQSNSYVMCYKSRKTDFFTGLTYTRVKEKKQ